MGKTKKGKKEPHVRQKDVAGKRVATATTTKAAKSRKSTNSDDEDLEGVFSSLFRSWLM